MNLKNKLKWLIIVITSIHAIIMLKNYSEDKLTRIQETGNDSAKDVYSEMPEENSEEDEGNEDMKANREFFREREKVYSERRKRLKSVCDQLGDTVSYGSLASVPHGRLRWLMSHKLIMCFIPKVGTSTWTQYLLEAEFPGLLKNVSNWHGTAQKFLGPPDRIISRKTLALMRKYGKAMIVRHPFTRIVSAYFDKVVSKSYPKLRRYVIDRYRPRNSSLTSKHPSFEEFVQFLVEFTPIDDDIRVKKANRTDRHWLPYYVNCAPCDIHYDVIATLESAKEDTRYLLRKYQLGQPEGVRRNHHNISTELTALTLFKNLPRNLTLALHQRYRVDFLMFGYNVTDYLASS
ncbi:carbohydrate sulfotransferase 14-like isoform X1 [Panulirus ornatus]|uniref:carbohydrate sulfotransferase 14-like isoform X1 n=1 Tax=Panulirus ornatus TaxID=150431 RepID=UPI003A8ADE7E